MMCRKLSKRFEGAGEQVGNESPAALLLMVNGRRQGNNGKE